MKIKKNIFFSFFWGGVGRGRGGVGGGGFDQGLGWGR